MSKRNQCGDYYFVSAQCTKESVIEKAEAKLRERYIMCLRFCFQAGRDYEAFFKTSAWGANEGKPAMKPSDSASERTSAAPEVPRRLDLSQFMASPDKPETGKATGDIGHPQRPQRVFPTAETTQDTKS